MTMFTAPGTGRRVDIRQHCGALASGRRPHPAGALPPAPHSNLQEHHALRLPTPQLAAPLWAASAPRAAPLAAAAGEAVAQGEAEDEAAPEEEMWCAPAFVSVDNRKNPNFTVMEVEVLDYPGLVRVIAWVLNGLDLVAQNAVLSTSPDGLASNTFWLTNRAGKKLRDEAVELLVDRVRQFVTHCSPPPSRLAAPEVAAGPISVSNAEHEAYTVVMVREKGGRKPGFLLEVASVLGGLNVQVLQGVIQGCTDCGEDVPAITSEMSKDTAGGRLLKFWVRNQEGSKLDAGHVRALVYALGMALGFSTHRFPVNPPNHEDV